MYNAVMNLLLRTPTLYKETMKLSHIGEFYRKLQKYDEANINQMIISSDYAEKDAMWMKNQRKIRKKNKKRKVNEIYEESSKEDIVNRGKILNQMNRELLRKFLRQIRNLNQGGKIRP